MGIILRELANLDFNPLTGMYRIFITFSLVTIIFSCDKRTDIDLNGITEKHIEFNCGSVDIKAYAVARSIFNIEQNFNLSGSSVVYKDSLRVTHNGNQLDYSLSHEGQEVTSTLFDITNGEVLVVSFNVHNPLPDVGDTVIVEDYGYLYCDGNHVDFGEIIMTVK